MKKILTLGFILLSITYVNCRKDIKSNSTFVANRIAVIYYKDVSGHDLLNPSQPNSYSTENIHVYDIKNGQKTEVDNPNLDMGHDFRIEKDSTRYYLKLILETDTVLLQLNKNMTDTITATFDRGSNYNVVTKIWYNSTLKWQAGVPAIFTIVK